MEQTHTAQQVGARGMQALDFGMRWVREFAEEGFEQSKLALEGMFNATKQMSNKFDNQSSAIREHTSSFAETALKNTMDFGQRAFHAKAPTELLSLQAEFISRQAEAFAEQTKQLGHKIQQVTEESTRAAESAVAEMAQKAEAQHQSANARMEQAAKRTWQR